MRVPLSLITGSILPAGDKLLVTWVKVLVVVSKRKTSKLPSGFAPVRFPIAEKAMRVPAAFITARTLGGPAAPAPVVTWVKVVVVMSKRKISPGLSPVRLAVEVREPLGRRGYQRR
jgi:hypothetical protein